MSYLNSNQIKIFPFAKYRGKTSNDIASRLFYETNVARFINQIVDVNGYIIDGDISELGVVTETLQLSIHGYYFQIEKGTDITLPDSSVVYGKIKISKPISDTEGITKPSEIQGNDNNGNFEAFELTSTPIDFEEDDNYFYYGFKLAKKILGKWELPKDSFCKFFVNSLKITEIDGKI